MIQAKGCRSTKTSGAPSTFIGRNAPRLNRRRWPNLAAAEISFNNCRGTRGSVHPLLSPPIEWLASFSVADDLSRTRIDEVDSRTNRASDWLKGPFVLGRITVWAQAINQRLPATSQFCGSTSPLPPQTPHRYWPVPLHSLQVPIELPTAESFPLPRHAGQDTVLWPWHFEHRTLFGIGIELSKALALFEAKNTVQS